jgi:hypothetical protein
LKSGTDKSAWLSLAGQDMMSNHELPDPHVIQQSVNAAQ